MVPSESVKTGLWLDQDRGWPYNLQITTLNGWVIFVQLALGVCLGAVWPSLSLIITRIGQWARYGWQNFRTTSERGQHDEPAHLDADGPEAHAPLHQDGPDEHAPLLGNELNGAANQDQKVERSWTSNFLSFVTIIVFIGWAVAGSMSTAMPAKSLGLSSSTTCGSWILRRGVSEKALADDALIQAEKERRAGEYAHACYGPRTVTNPDQCSFFNVRAISSEVTQTDCPFKNQSFCAGGGLQIARRFTTGLVDARLLGVNIANSPKFNRTTICVPLDIDQGFVWEIPPDKHHFDYRYEYHLGSRNNGRWNYTFRTSGDPFNYKVPAYTIRLSVPAVLMNRPPYGREHDYWIPTPELKIKYPGKTYLTIMFISSCRIIYRGACEDYIFPATEEYPLNSGRFRNGDIRARPLACIDWNEVCTHDGVCTSMEDEHEGYGIAYEYTRSAMRESTIYKAIKARLGNALLANEKVGTYESFRLDPEQWVIESQALFNTSLARIQYDALDVAVGAGHEKAPESYEEVTPKWARGKLCNMYKFQLPKEYANINFWALVGIPLVVLVILGLGQEAGKGSFTDDEHPLKGELLWFDVILSWIIELIGSCARFANHAVQGWSRRRENRRQRRQAPAVVMNHDANASADPHLTELGGDHTPPELD